MGRGQTPAAAILYGNTGARGLSAIGASTTTLNIRQQALLETLFNLYEENPKEVWPYWKIVRENKQFKFSPQKASLVLVSLRDRGLVESHDGISSKRWRITQSGLEHYNLFCS